MSSYFSCFHYIFLSFLIAGISYEVINGKQRTLLAVGDFDWYNKWVNWRQLLLHKQSRAFMAMSPLSQLRPIVRRASFSFSSCSSSAVKWEGGVSMVQGASRGIGLEFVSFFFISNGFSTFIIVKFYFPINIFSIWVADLAKRVRNCIL